MGLLISKPTGKLSHISIRALLVIFKKEVIEKKLFNTLTKLAWGHRSPRASPHLPPWLPAPPPPGLLSSTPSLALGGDTGSLERWPEDLTHGQYTWEAKRVSPFSWLFIQSGNWRASPRLLIPVASQ